MKVERINSRTRLSELNAANAAAANAATAAANAHSQPAHSQSDSQTPPETGSRTGTHSAIHHSTARLPPSTATSQNERLSALDSPTSSRTTSEDKAAASFQPKSKDI